MNPPRFLRRGFTCYFATQHKQHNFPQTSDKLITLAKRLAAIRRAPSSTLAQLCQSGGQTFPLSEVKSKLLAGMLVAVTLLVLLAWCGRSLMNFFFLAGVIIAGRAPQDE